MYFTCLCCLASLLEKLCVVCVYFLAQNTRVLENQASLLELLRMSYF